MTQPNQTRNTQFEAAKRAFSSGKLEAAGRICEAIVAAQPTMSQAWFLLSCVYHRMAIHDDAITTIQNAIRLAPFEAAYHGQAGEIFQDAGKLAEAEAHFLRALQLNPDSHQIHNSLGILFADTRRPDEALSAFRKSTELKPDFAIALNNLGTALTARGEYKEALTLFQRSVSAKPDYASAQSNLGSALLRAGDQTAALAAFEKAVALRPELAEAHFAAAGIYRTLGRGREALAAYGEATRRKPTEPLFTNGLAEFIWQQGDYDSALAMYRHSLSFAPRNLRAQLCANLLLPVVPRDRQQVEETRARFAAGLTNLETIVPGLLGNSQAELERDIQWDNFYLAYQGGDDYALQVRYAALVKTVLSGIAPDLYVDRKSELAGRKVRIGFASHNFYDCTVGQYFASWITELSPERFEISVYHLNPASDRITERIRNAASNFRPLAGTGLLSAARTVAADNLDILVYPELGMFPMLFCMASLRLAPVQCAAWGHPVTTGHANIDYFISCHEMEPPDASNHYSEKLVTLPGLGTQYEMPDSGELADRSSFGLPEDRILYLIPQSLYKIHPDNDSLIAAVLAAEPKAVAVMFETDNQELAAKIFAARIQAELEKRGAQTAGRIHLLPRMARSDYLRVNRVCDVMLDTVHWSGGNTSLDAIASGLPIVTLPGAFMRGRQSFAMLRLMDCGEMIARDSDHYVELALRIGRDPALRNRLAERMLGGRSLIFGRREPVRALEQFLLAATGGGG